MATAKAVGNSLVVGIFLAIGKYLHYIYEITRTRPKIAKGRISGRNKRKKKKKKKEKKKKRRKKKKLTFSFYTLPSLSLRLNKSGKRLNPVAS